MSDNMPTAALLAGLWNRFRNNAEGGNAGITCYPEFYRWHAEEIRAAKAETLREAAQAMYDSKGCDLILDETGDTDHIGKDNSATVSYWLTNRAEHL